MFEAVVTFGGAILGSMVGVAYFAGAPRDVPYWQRLTSAAFGPVTALLFVAAAFLWPAGYRYQPAGIRAFYLLQLLPLALLLYSIRYYRGPRGFHLALVPLGLLAWLWTFALGFLAVHGE